MDLSGLGRTLWQTEAAPRSVLCRMGAPRGLVTGLLPASEEQDGDLVDSPGAGFESWLRCVLSHVLLNVFVP